MDATKSADAHGLSVAEVVCYAEDWTACRDFYVDKLGWSLMYEFGDQFASISCDGAYQLSLVSAQWSEGFEPGGPTPAANLSFQSRDLAVDREQLIALGNDCGEISGDPSMYFMSIAHPYAAALIFWQDATSDVTATKAVDAHMARAEPSTRYGMGETLVFVDNLPEATEWYTSRLAFQIVQEHGSVYKALKLNDADRYVGLMDWAEWWGGSAGTPTGGDNAAGPAPLRLCFECLDIASEHARLVESGADPEELQGEAGDLQWFSVSDPAGNVVTFWQFAAGGQP
jgi:catechol 2,3-dioxygenase-like lactoylglutathione lyase family enzyme